MRCKDLEELLSAYADGELPRTQREFVEKHLLDIQDYHPDIEIERYSVQQDHVHLVMIIPPKYAVSEVVGKIKVNTRK